MNRKTFAAKRLTKKLRQRRYRAKHKEQEATRSFKRAQSDMRVFLWFLYPALFRLAYMKSIPICSQKDFAKELDRAEFKKCFIEWKRAGNPEHLKPVITLTHFKEGFIYGNMNWAPIDPFHIEARKDKVLLTSLIAKMDIEQRLGNKYGHKAAQEIIARGGNITDEDIAKAKEWKDKIVTTIKAQAAARRFSK